ncbi:hypothetical protein ABE068_21810 [Bacillus glycinifermentans]|uniref:Phosphatase n=1 Tax=Bacillus glycinifermentans TaxID=1664069 RepID=A0ABU6GXL5_9BACI|nr:hypothetical protein [Bacillus glycinifermentans]MEC0483526.1 hypothetical protein [Bacillus glycinifermentans]MEC3609429.1 hypothetical protein [Bacillus glycinifermentans]
MKIKFILCTILLLGAVGVTGASFAQLDSTATYHVADRMAI